MPELFPNVISNAGISDCGHYRYWLTRTWDDRKPVICWIMLNPSTADAQQDDPTIRRVMGFSRAWGAGGVCVVNLFALRATDPEALKAHYPVDMKEDEKNNQAILSAARNRRIIAAWGCHGSLLHRDKSVVALLSGMKIECLGVTSNGHPRHPLYVRGSTIPVLFERNHA